MATYNITIKQGETFRVPLTYRDADDAIVPLQGQSAWMHIRKTLEATDTLFTLTTGNSRILTADTDPNITLYISDEDTATITTWQSGVYDLLVELANGDRKRLIEGTVTVELASTRGV